MRTKGKKIFDGDYRVKEKRLAEDKVDDSKRAIEKYQTVFDREREG